MGFITVLLKFIVEMKKGASFYRPDQGLKLTPFIDLVERLEKIASHKLYIMNRIAITSGFAVCGGLTTKQQ